MAGAGKEEGDRRKDSIRKGEKEKRMDHGCVLVWSS